MRLNKKKIKDLLILFIPLIIIIIGLFITNNLLWTIFIFALLVWFFILFNSFFSDVFELLIKYINKKFQYNQENNSKYKKINKYIFKDFFPIFFAVIIFILIFNPSMAILTSWKAEQNKPEFEKLVTQLIEGKDTNETKARAILEWFDNETGNIYNDWRLRNQLLYPPNGGMIKFYSTYPYLTIRTYNDKDALWILTSQFGHCGEYSNLYRAMADYAGLKVRKVCSDGENHCWNEVYINDTIRWKIVDPTNVFLDEEKNGYDGINLSWLKNKLGGNFTHVSAQEKGGKYINITRYYTTEVNITILTVDNNQKPISGVTVKLFSNNRDKERDTNIEKVTNEYGEYTFTIGMGNYTFKATKGNLYGEKTEIFSDEYLNHNRIITLE